MDRTPIQVVDEAEIRRFVRLARPDGGDLTVLRISDQGGSPAAQTFTVPAATDALIGHVRQHNASHQNIYWLPNETRLADRKPGKRDITAARFAWADCDPDINAFGSYEAARQHLTGVHATQLAPIASFVIDSGNGLQAFFRLAQPIDMASGRAEYEHVNEALGRAFDGPGTFNCDRIMRVPGTWNWPTRTKLKKGYPDQPGFSRILSEADNTCTLDALRELAQSRGAVPVEPTPEASPTAGHPGTNSETGEVDAARRFADLLKADAKLRARWEGDASGLRDKSGSAMDLSLYAMLVTRRFPHDDAVAIMTPWPHGSVASRQQGERYWDRLRDNTVASPAELAPEDRAVHELNARHAYVLLGSSGAVLWEHEAHADFLKLDAFKQYYANQLVEVESTDRRGRTTTKWLPAADIWMRHRERRTYDGVEFAPRGARRSYYNLWRGFAVEPLEGAGVFRSGLRCRRLLSHVKYNVCQGDRDRFRYFLKWCADMIQRPDDKPGVAVSVSGEKGVGKSKVIEALAGLLGRHALSVSQPEHLLGRFNAHQAHALLLAAEESFWAGDKKAEGVLKHMITSPTVMTERKGVDVIETQSLTRFMFIGNANWLFPASADERRLFALTCGSRRKGNFAYFRAIDDQLYGAGKRRHVAGQASPGLRALLTFLLSVDLAGFEIRDIPETEALRDQRAATLEPHDQFLLDCLNNQEIAGIPWGDSELRISKQAFYQSFTDAAHARGRAFLVSQSAFAKRVHDVFRWRDGRIRSEPRHWCVAPWTKTREAFESKMKVNVDETESLLPDPRAWLLSQQELSNSLDFADLDSVADLL